MRLYADQKIYFMEVHRLLPNLHVQFLCKAYQNLEITFQSKKPRRNRDFFINLSICLVFDYFFGDQCFVRCKYF